MIGLKSEKKQNKYSRINKQTHRQTDKQTDRQTYIQVDRLSYKLAKLNKNNAHTELQNKNDGNDCARRERRGDYTL